MTYERLVEICKRYNIWDPRNSERIHLEFNILRTGPIPLTEEDLLSILNRRSSNVF